MKQTQTQTQTQTQMQMHTQMQMQVQTPTPGRAPGRMRTRARVRVRSAMARRSAHQRLAHRHTGRTQAHGRDGDGLRLRVSAYVQQQQQQCDQAHDPTQGQGQGEGEASTSGRGGWRDEHARALPYECVPEMFLHLAKAHGRQTAVVDAHHEPHAQLTYAQLLEDVLAFAAGLRALGLSAGDAMALFSENGARWLVADQASMTLGAANALRGVTSTAQELRFILDNSRAVGLVVQDKHTLEHITNANANANGSDASQGFDRLQFVIVLWGEVDRQVNEQRFSCPVYSYEQIMQIGKEELGQLLGGTAMEDASYDQLYEKVAHANKEEDIATIIYTSGTTGEPKGAMLTHGNLMFQVSHLHHTITVPQGSQNLLLLPPWHVYALATTYFAFSNGVTSRYSNVQHFRTDITKYGTDFLVAVPLVIENLYKRVMVQVNAFSSVKRALVKAFIALSTAYVIARRTLEGLNLQYATRKPGMLVMLKSMLLSLILRPIHLLANALVYKQIRGKINIQSVIVSGGGALAEYLEDFFEVVGVNIINGWGLTETSPVLAAREVPGLVHPNVRGTIGKPVPGTQIKVVDPNTFEDVPDGEKGLLIAKGATIFREYCQNEAETKKAFRYGDRWYDTGDLGYKIPDLAHHNMGGMFVHVGREKETIVLSSGKNVEPSPLENQCLASPYVSQIMIVGQDRKALGALIVPDYEYFEELGVSKESSEILSTVRKEVQSSIENGPMYEPYEMVRHFTILEEPLTFEDGFLTRTLKIKRHTVAEHFSSELESMFL